MKKNICIFCGSRDGNNLDMIAKTAEVGRELSYAGFGIVFGGGRLGLMGAVAKAAIEANGSVIGIIPKGLTSREPIQQQLTELYVVDDIIERKRMMIEKSDAFLILPGGLGTLDELFEVWTGLQVGAHKKPIIIANWGNYYNQLLAFLKQADDHGFLNGDHLRGAEVINDIDGIVSTLKKSLGN
jgi:hypothetical protein